MVNGQQPTVPVKVETKPADDIRSLLSSTAAKKQFAMALPKHLKPDRFVRVALTAINRNPKLLQCTKSSLLSCFMDLSQLGLEPDGRKVHLIPYKDVCTIIIDYKGLVELARRSGEISDIHADVVYENDEFNYSFGTEGKLVHKPSLSDRGNPIAAYSFVKLKDGSSSYEVMNVQEVEAIHKRSRAGESGPWITDWAEMAKKTVFRRHSKWLPVSSEFQTAIEKDYDVATDIVTEKSSFTLPEKVQEEPTSEQPIKTEAIVEKPTPDPRTEIKMALNKAQFLIGEQALMKILGNLGFDNKNDVQTKDLNKVLAEVDKVYKSS